MIEGSLQLAVFLEEYQLPGTCYFLERRRSYCYGWSISVCACGLKVVEVELPVNSFEIVGPASDISAR